MLRVAATAVVCVSALNGITAANDLSPQPAYADTSLKLTVTSPRSTIVRLEPLYVNCTLYNTSMLPVATEVRSLSLEDKFLSIAIGQDDGTRHDYYSGLIIDTLGKKLSDVAPSGYPGDTMEETITIFFNDVTGKLAFPSIGKYTIIGRVYLGRLPDPKFVSALPSEIEVIQPMTVDLHVIDELGGEDRMSGLFRDGASAYCEGKEKDDCYSTLRNVAVRYSDSAYATPIWFSTARAVSDRPALEVNLLQEFLARWPDHPLAYNAMKVLVVTLKKTGRNEEAARWSEKLKARRAGSQSDKH